MFASISMQEPIPPGSGHESRMPVASLPPISRKGPAHVPIPPPNQLGAGPRDSGIERPLSGPVEEELAIQAVMDPLSFRHTDDHFGNNWSHCRLDVDESPSSRFLAK